MNKENTLPDALTYLLLVITMVTPYDTVCILVLDQVRQNGKRWNRSRNLYSKFFVYYAISIWVYLYGQSGDYNLFKYFCVDIPTYIRIY